MTERSDGELLEAFRMNADDAAFGELVRRHGGLVVSGAVSVTGDRSAADDIAQATFLTLARKASSINDSQSVAGWLYRVAVRLARNECRRKARRTEREKQVIAVGDGSDKPLAVSESAITALYEEVAGLPELHRIPVVLHYMEGLSYEAAAAAVGCKVNTFGNRLARGREKLKKRLVKRGITLGSAALIAALGETASAAEVSAGFVAATCAAAKGGAVSAKVTALTQGALKMLFWAKVQAVTTVCAATVLVGGAGVATAVIVPALMEKQDRQTVQAPADTTVPETGMPVAEISFGEWDGRMLMFRRLWWNPRDMTLEGEDSQIHNNVTGLFRWSLAGPTDQPASFLGRAGFGGARHLVRLADGRLLGLDAPWSAVGPLPECAPVELQPEARRLGPGVVFDASSIKMTACDAEGRYFMAALKATNANGGGRVLIWDLKAQVLAADLTDLPTKRHKMGDFGFPACAVAPDAGLGVVVDSGGGLLVLDLPKGVVRHRLALPVPQHPQPYGLDLVWEADELVCRGWPSLGKGTVRVDPVAGVIRERFDHPVIRGGDMTIHVRGNELEVVRTGAAVSLIRLPPMKWGQSSVSAAAGVSGWRCSPDGRWLSGTMGVGAVHVLVDLQKGRCVSPGEGRGARGEI